MGFTSRLVASMKDIDRKVWPDHRVAISSEIAKILEQKNLIVADVGSADGPEAIWLSLKQLTRFLTFEPNPRDQPPDESIRATNFPIGLWSEKGEKTLYLTGHPDSSSLLPINTALFSDFLSKDGMEMVGTTTIEVDTLDGLLLQKPEFWPDFVKIDVEGGDLEVLKGGRQILAQSVLGLRVETAFLELHLGAPLLWEVDSFLREQGFVLFHLGRNHWIRNNGLHGLTSEPQVIWGDAVYFLTLDHFIKRLSKCKDAERHAILAKFIVVLVRHGVHDYSWDVIQAAEASKFVTTEFAGKLRALVRASMDTGLWYLVKGFLGMVFAFGVLLVSFPFGEPRKRAVFYVKQRVGRFCYDLWRRMALGGRARHACLTDPFV